MNILIVLHDASRTGAPRVGGLIAGSLAHSHNVEMVCLEGGALLGWLRARLPQGQTTVLGAQTWNGKTRTFMPFNRRVEAARSFLEGRSFDLVYVNSVASSEFAVAAGQVGIPVMLHVHEKAAEIRRLCHNQVTPADLLSYTDRVVLAAPSLQQDVEELLGPIPGRPIDFGIALDIAEIRELATASGKPAVSASGKPYRAAGRFLVGMVGVASKRKGSDIFLETARRTPECDFIWVGDWAPPAANDAETHDAFRKERLSNVYVTEGTDNPYRFMQGLDLLFLSSREDPNPLVIAEAQVLGVPVMAFSAATGVTGRLGRHAILLHGRPNGEDAARLIARLAGDPEPVRALSRAAAAEAAREFDIVQRVAALEPAIEELGRAHARKRVAQE